MRPIQRQTPRLNNHKKISFVIYTPTVMSVFKGSGLEIPSAVMFRLPPVMQAGAVEGGN
jgi:hypothetical protein